MGKLQNLLLERRLRQYKANPFDLVRSGLMKIKTKNDGIVYLTPNRIQLKLLKYIEERWFKYNLPILINILKARQEGITTIVSALFTVLTAALEGINSIIISDKLEGSQYIVDMYKLYYKELRKENTRLMSDTHRDNVNGLLFKNTLSRVLIDTASNVSAGRKYTFNLVHNSEVCFWPINPKELMIGLMQAMPDTRCLCINETTANGVGDYFYNEFKKGMEGDSDWVSMFFSWHEFDNYEKDYLPEEKEELLRTLDEEEKTLISSFQHEFKYHEDSIVRKLIWRRWCIKNKCQGDLDYFHQEYPATWEEAFLVSGRARFSTKSLLSLEEECIDPIKRGFYNSKHEWEDNPKGYIRIYRDKEPLCRYVAGIDTAEGRLVAKVGGRPDTDNNSVHILESTTQDVVATITMQGDPDLFAEQAYLLSKHYNDAFIGIENNKGQAVISYFKRMDYWNLYQNVVYDEQLEREQKVIGWNTNQKTRRLMIDELAIYVREKLGKIYDKFTIHELFTFIIKDDGKVEAQDGCHDDRVFSLGIAVQMLKHQGYMEEMLKPAAPVGSWQWEYDDLLKTKEAHKYDDEEMARYA